MTKINLSIPDSLRAEMKKWPENWSEVARLAFEARVQFHKFKEVSTIDEVIERLRASKATAEGHDQMTGRADGERWAKKHASYRELRRIGDLDLDPDEGSYASQFDRALGKSGTDWGTSFWNDGEFESAP